MEPPVSEPSATTAMSAATAAAEPPEDPPGTRLRSRGIVYRMQGGVLVRRAHGELVAIQLAEYDCSGGFEARHRSAVVGRNDSCRESSSQRWCARRACTITSLIPTGTPPSGGSGLPSAASASMRSACCQRAIARQGQVGPDRRIVFLNSRVERFRQRRGGGLALLDGGARGVDGEQA